MKMWYMGSGSWGAQCLRELARLSYNPELVITSGPRPSGRGLRRKPNDVEEMAYWLDIEVRRSENINDDVIIKEKLMLNSPELIVVIDFGQKIKEPFLSTPKFGCINLHPSLLPKYRGAAPIQRAIMDGQQITGVTVFRLTESLDAGPILAQNKVYIDLDDTAGTLGEKLRCRGIELLINTLDALPKGIYEFREQDESEATYAPKITNEEALFDFNEEALKIHNKVRALNPEPGAYTLINDKRLKVWRTKLINNDEVFAPVGTIFKIVDGFPVVACGKGAVLLLEVQREGKKVVNGRSFLNGLRLREGDVLTC